MIYRNYYSDVYTRQKRNLSGILFSSSLFSFVYGNDSGSETETFLTNMFSYNSSLLVESNLSENSVHLSDSSSSIESYIRKFYISDSGSGTENQLTSIISTSFVYSSDSAFGLESSFVITTFIPPAQTALIPILLLAPSPPDSAFGAVTTGIGVPTQNFTVQPVKPYSGIIMPSDGNTLIPNYSGVFLLPSGSSVFNPPFLIFNNSIVPQTFTYTPIKNGYKPISISGPNASPSAPVWVFVNPNWPNRN